MESGYCPEHGIYVRTYGKDEILEYGYPGFMHFNQKVFNHLEKLESEEKVTPDWKNTLFPHKIGIGTVVNMYEHAKNLAYTYFVWNGRLYNTTDFYTKGFEQSCIGIVSEE